MASANIVSCLESKIDAQSSKYNFLIALVGAGLTFALAVGWLIVTSSKISHYPYNLSKCLPKVIELS